VAVTPFRIAVPDAALDELRAAIVRTRWPDQVEDAGWDYGAELGFVQELVAYWADGFDWRAREQVLNSVPQYRAEVDAPGFEGFGLHFVHQPGVGAAPLPLVLTHGWPSTHYEYHDVVARLANPGAFGDDPADAFHVVVPSLPGYGFSDIPRRRGMTPRVMATMFVALMRELGYDRFAAAGCDWGAYVTALLGLDHPDALVGVHMGMLNFRAADPYEPTADDADYGTRAKAWRREESGYSEIQGTKPQSLAYGLMDSPAALTAWIVEKWRRWSDCAGDVQQLFTRDELLTTVAIYWFTGTINSANRLYYESRRDPVRLSEGERVQPPAGFLFERVVGAPTPNIGPPPRRRADAVYDVRRWTVADRGLHFPAMENPDVYVEELREFFRPLRARDI
jgi:pimeloyl-ACP methyl ester carboxylesterase